MLVSEKERLLALFADRRCWCQGAEARDASGDAVHFDDPAAVAWDLTGAVCLLFGWPRALELFHQLDEHIRRVKRNSLPLHNPDIASMASLQDRNDDSDTTFEMVTGWLHSMPVWSDHHKVY
jgi:hypothetical protein